MQAFDLSLKVPSRLGRAIEASLKRLLQDKLNMLMVQINIDFSTSPLANTCSINLRGDLDDLNVAFADICNQLESLQDVLRTDDANMARLNNLQNRLTTYKNRYAKRKKQTEEQAAQLAQYEQEIHVPDISSSSDDDSGSSLDEHRHYGIFSSQRSRKLKKQIKKREGKEKSALSSQCMKIMLERFIDTLARTPKKEEVAAEFGDFRSAFLIFIRNHYPIWRDIKGTHGFAQSCKYHLTNSHSELCNVVTVNGKEKLIIFVALDFPS